MSMWRCPHCGTPQAESARCWVCRRSSTACGTCRHFRRSVAAQLGYCGLDRKRLPLRGDEIRACWEGRPAVIADEQPAAPVPVHRLRVGQIADQDRTAVRKLEFVPVGEDAKPARRVSKSAPNDEANAGQPQPQRVSGAPVAAEPAWNLWGDLEP
jgi:hypothetical protein